MSAIALFYVVPDERLTDIIAAATPVPGGWFRPARDEFWDVLRSSGRELETFAWSGWVFNTLDLDLENRHGFMYANFGDAPTSRQFRKRAVRIGSSCRQPPPLNCWPRSMVSNAKPAM
jgi:hypothetical protein